jgi:RimJ/RimL family protein N-acetyltransferase
MDLAALRSSVDRLSREFATKDGRRLSLEVLQAEVDRPLVERYLAFQPRNSFQGLPPLKDEVCVKWVADMLRTGIHVLARTREATIAGHTAIFPIDHRKCEMLVVVWPEFQNIGIGTALVQSSIKMARQLHFERIWLPVDATNSRARHIYAKCGFEKVSRGQGREVDMVCDLVRVEAEKVAAHLPPVAPAMTPPVFPSKQRREAGRPKVLVVRECLGQAKSAHHAE